MIIEIIEKLDKRIEECSYVPRAQDYVKGLSDALELVKKISGAPEEEGEEK